MQFERIVHVPHLRTPFRFYSMDELEKMPDAALRDLEERVAAHRNKIRRTFSARSAADPFASSDVLVAIIKREQNWRTRTRQTRPAQGWESSHDESSSEGADD